MTQNIFNIIIIALLGGIIIAILSWRKAVTSCEENEITSVETCKIEQQDVTTMIRTFFDSRQWKYRMYTEEDSVVSFALAFRGDNEETMFRIDVMPNNNIYHIIGQSNTTIPTSNVNAGIRAINQYNLRAKVVSGCVCDNGAITFWLGRNTDGGTFSEDAFSYDFDMVMRAVDDESAHIFKEAMENN